MSFGFFAGAGLALALILGASILSGRHVKNADEFDLGSRGSGTLITSATIMGIIVGGSATVGTAQLSFNHGFSACWFTLGSGIGIAIMGLTQSDRMRSSGEVTLGGIIGREFGGGVRTLSSICIGIGCAFSLMSQLLSGAAIADSLFPGLPNGIGIVLVSAFVLIYVIFGGIKSAGLGGLMKTLLLFPSVLFCGYLAIKGAGGLGAIAKVLPAQRFFNPFARGLLKDGGAGFSVILGVLSSQAYTQVIVAARTDRIAKCSTFYCAILVPLLGLGGIPVGYYMRLHTDPAVLADPVLSASAAKTAFPDFIRSHCSPFFTGVILATILMAVTATAAGLLLSFSTIVHRDIVNRLTDKFKEGRVSLALSRICILVLLAATTVCSLFMNSYIMDLSFVSMGLRATSGVALIYCALYFPGRAKTGFAYASIILGLLSALFLKLLSSPIDPASGGALVSILVMVAGVLAGKKGAVQKD